VTFPRSFVAPFRPARASADRRLSPTVCCLPPSRGWLPLRAVPRSLGLPRGFPRRTRARCFSPTSATDRRHEHPWIARLPGARLAPRSRRVLHARTSRTLLPCDAAPPCGDAAPAALRLTAPSSFDASHAVCRPAFSRTQVRRRSRGIPHQPGIVFPVGAARVVSDISCRAPRRAEPRPDASRGARIASAVPSSTGTVFPIRNAFHRRVLSGHACARSISRIG
jgi:hypothetical protein